MRLCLVEDNAASGLEPLSLTRPVFDLRLGSSMLGRKVARAFGVVRDSARRGALVRPHLAEPLRAREPLTAVNDPRWLALGPLVVANGRWVPADGFLAPDLRRPTVGLCAGRPACAWVGPGQAIGLEWHVVECWFEGLAGELDAVELGGEWVECPGDLVDKNVDHLISDLESSGMASRGAGHLGHVTIAGPPGRLAVHPTAQVDPDTAFDTTRGPIAIEAGAVVRGSSRVEGPCYIGRDSQLSRADIRGGVTIGPGCWIGGEVERSIVHGHFRLDHGGSLAHVYVGDPDSTSPDDAHEKRPGGAPLLMPGYACRS